MLLFGFFFCLLQSANWVADADCVDVALLRLRIVDVKLLYVVLIGVFVAV